MSSQQTPPDKLIFRWRQRLQVYLRGLLHFPWKGTAITLFQRFREDRLGLTASSLTFTSTMALVPFVTVALAVFTAFPMFSRFQAVLQRWLLESLIPDNIARQVLGYLTQFASQSSKLGGVGVAILVVTALALILTIDRTLNAIWRVRTARSLGQRMLVYWAALTLGPLLLGVSLSITSYALSASRGVVSALPGGLPLLLDVLQFFMLAAAMAALYNYVPNTRVRWSHAWVGGLFVSAAIEVAKKLLTLYLGKVPTYSVIYGAFATVPILLIWIYIAWVIVLLGAVITAYLPSLLAAHQARAGSQGWQFQLALEVLQQLEHSRHTPGRGLSMEQLVSQLRVDALQLEPVLETLCELDWVGLLQEERSDQIARYVFLADPDATPLAPLLDTLLLRRQISTQSLWTNARWNTLTLRDAL